MVCRMSSDQKKANVILNKMRSAGGRIQMAIILLMIGITAQAQPVLVKEISSGSTDFKAVGDFVYYVSNDSLFRTDGTAGGTIFLKSGVHRPANFYEFAGKLFFLSRSNFNGH